MFKKCPLEFRHIYVDRDIPKKDSEALRYGSFLHSVIEDISNAIKDNGGVIPDNIASLATKSWKRHGKLYKISGELLKESRSILKQYGQIVRGTTDAKIISNEHSFNFTVEGDYHIVGKIDQILGKKDKYLVRDYKTNKSSKYLLRDPLQLKIYSLAVSKELDISPEQIITSFMFLRLGCEEKRKKFSTSEIEETEKFLHDIGEEINNCISSKEFVAKIGPLCPWCPAIDKCAKAQSQRWIMEKYNKLVMQGVV